MDIQKFARLITQRRKELGMTQSELGRHLGVTDKAVSKWERGLSYPDIDVLRPLAAVLHLNLEEILGEQFGDIAQSSNIHRSTPLEGIADVLSADVPLQFSTGSETVSPLLFGVNLEHTRSWFYTGLSAQMLKNRKFAGKPSACSGHAMQWYPIGDRALFLFDKAYTRHHELYHMKRSHECNAQRIVNPIAGAVSGIGQHELSVQKGKTYEFRIVVKTSAPVELTVALTSRHGKQTYASCRLAVSADQWQSYEARMECPETDADGDLRITFCQQASVCIGAVSLMPDDHFRGMRRDVIACLKEAGFRMLRWPGGNFAGEYNWLDGLLPVDMRAPLESCLGIETQPHSMGYDYHEINTDDFIALCRQIGAEPFITINPCWNTADENAAWVEYCNGGPETTYGQMRIQRGFAQPYHVRYWSLGNEFGFGHMEGDNSPGGYCKTALEHGRKMQTVSAQLQLCSSGPYPNTRWVQESAIPLREVANLISQHFYAHAPAYPDAEHFEKEYYACLSGVFHLRKQLRQTRQELPEDVRISLDEWNVWYAWYRPSSVTDGIFAALALHMIIDESRRCDIALACHFEAINEGIIRVLADGAHLTAQGQVFAAMKNHIGGRICYSGPDAVVTRREDLVTVTVVNGAYDRPKRIVFPEGYRALELRLYTSPDVVPPSRFAITQLSPEVLSSNKAYTMPPHSFLLATVEPKEKVY